MKVTKVIYSIEKNCFLTVLHQGKKQYFYLERNLVKKFMKYLRKGHIVTFIATDELIHYQQVSCYKIIYFEKIALQKKHEQKIYYHIDTIRSGIKKLIKNMRYMLFVDFEMNMQEFQSIQDFKQEIIEFGYYLTDHNGQIYDVGHYYIKPTLFNVITRRTKKFLHYDDQVFAQAVEYEVFYEKLRELNSEYHPHVIVWGKSDILTLKQSFLINNKAVIDLKYIDLLQLHQNYYNYKNSPGLFKMWQAYYSKELPDQRHYALEDAKITYEVFFGFKEFIFKE